MTDEELAAIKETWRVHNEAEWDNLWHKIAMRWMMPALIADVEASREIVRAVAELPLDSCACLIDDPFATTHAPDCWIHKARALLGDA